MATKKAISTDDSPRTILDPELVKTIDKTWEHYGRTPPEITYQLFAVGLNKFDIQQVKRAFLTYLTHPAIDQRDPPNPGDIVRILNGGDLHALALEQWAAVERTIRTIATTASVCFDDPVTMCVIRDMGGWRRFMRSMESQLHDLERAFVDRYESSYLGVTTHKREIPQRFDSPDHDHNRAYGFVIEDDQESLVLIGDKKKAEQILINDSKERIQPTRGIPHRTSLRLPGIIKRGSKP